MNKEIFKDCKTRDDVLAIADKYGISFTEEEIKDVIGGLIVYPSTLGKGTELPGKTEKTEIGLKQ